MSQNMSVKMRQKKSILYKKKLLVKDRGSRSQMTP